VTIREAFGPAARLQIKDCGRNRLGGSDSDFVKTDNAQEFARANAFPAAAVMRLPQANSYVRPSVLPLIMDARVKPAHDAGGSSYWQHLSTSHCRA
jgi:hypothetical protein